VTWGSVNYCRAFRDVVRSCNATTTSDLDIQPIRYWAASLTFRTKNVQITIRIGDVVDDISSREQ